MQPANVWCIKQDEREEETAGMEVQQPPAAAGQGGDIQLEGVEATARGEAPEAADVRDVSGGRPQARHQTWICAQCNVCAPHRAHRDGDHQGGDVATSHWLRAVGADEPVPTVPQQTPQQCRLPHQGGGARAQAVSL